MLIDTHTHLNDPVFKDNWREVVDEAVSAGVEKIIAVGEDMESSKRAVEMASEHEAVYAGVGIHPHHCQAMMGNSNVKTKMSNNTAWLDSSDKPQNDRMEKILKQVQDDRLDLHSVPSLSNMESLRNNIDKWVSEISQLVEKPRVVGVGEIGLDYKNVKVREDENFHQYVDLQKYLLAEQVKLAKEFGKPVILHSREAGQDVLEVLETVSSITTTPDPSLTRRGVKGVFHCYEGSKKYLKKILEAGFYVSFTGNITYSTDRAEVSKLVPLDRLLLETDSPVMVPEPLRSSLSRLVNRPVNVRILAQKQADIRNIQLHELIEQTTNNASRLFNF